MSKGTYTGINIQWPISELILSGKKTVETRTYPIPKHYLSKEMILIETPGKHGTFKARMRAIISFTNCFKYSSKSQFYKDEKKHLVSKDSDWAWADRVKWGWEVKVIKIFESPKTINKKKGILYTKNISLTDN